MDRQHNSAPRRLSLPPLPPSSFVPNFHLNGGDRMLQYAESDAQTQSQRPSRKHVRSYTVSAPKEAQLAPVQSLVHPLLDTNGSSLASNSLTVFNGPIEERRMTSMAPRRRTVDDARVFRRKKEHAVAVPLTEPEWERVIHRSNVLCGVRMETASSELQGPSVSGVPLLILTQDMIHKTPFIETKVIVEETTSKRDMSYMKAGWEKEALSMNPPFTSAPKTTALQRSIAQNEEESRHYFKASHTFSRLKLTIDTSTATQGLNEQFKKELNIALRDDSEKRKKLERLFDKWGHVVATEIVLGGEHRLITEAINVTRHTADHIHNQLEKRLKVPFRSTDKQDTLGSSIDQTEAYSSAINNLSSTYVGGDPRYHSDPQFAHWTKSIENCEHWDVIRRDKVIPVIDLLTPEQRHQILMAVPKPLIGRWLTESQLDVIRCSHFQVYQPRLTAEDVRNGWRSLGQTFDSRKVLIVKEAPGGVGALSSVDSVITSWKSRSPFHSDNFCRLTPSSTEYTVLGSIFQRGPFFRTREPQYDPSTYTCSIRADLLAPARYEMEPCRSVKGKGTVWNIVPVRENGMNTTLNLGMFQVGNGAQTPGTVMGLKLESIEIVNP